jgi:cell division septal protein FtsQ
MSRREERYFNSHHAVKRDYYQKNLQNPFFKKRNGAKDNLARNIKLIIIGLVVFAGLIIWVLFFSNLFLIKDIKINGLTRVSDFDVRTVTETQVNDGGGNFLSQKNLLLFNDNKLQEDLKSKYNFSEITIKKKIFHELSIDIKEREYAYIWGESDGGYYYIDKEAYLIEKIPSSFTPLVALIASSSTLATTSDINVLSPSPSATTTSQNEISTSTPMANNDLIWREALKEVKKINQDKYPIINNLSENKIESDKIKVDKTYLDFIAKLFDSFKKNPEPELGVSRFILDDEFNTIKVELKNGLLVYFSTREDWDSQINSFLVLKKELKDNFNKIIKKKIDLRYGAKVYYE